MSPHQAVAVALRIFAVWLGIYTLRTAASFAFVTQPNVPGLGVAVAFLAVTALLVVALWTFPRLIAGKLLSPVNAKAEPSGSPDLWLAMGCALLGLWLLTSALPSLILDTYRLVYYESTSDDSGLKHSVIYFVIEAGIGVWLVLGARGFRKLFWWLRHAGY